MAEKPTPPKTKIVHEPGLFEGVPSAIKDPWNWLLLATIAFIISLPYV